LSSIEDSTGLKKLVTVSLFTFASDVGCSFISSFFCFEIWIGIDNDFFGFFGLDISKSSSFSLIVFSIYSL